MKTSDWKSRSWSFDELSLLAHNDEMLIVDWLREVSVIPKDVKWRRASVSISTSLQREIPGLYLAESGYEFDRLGGGSPKQFMEWLAFEVSGTPENIGLKRMLDSLGKDDDGNRNQG